MMITSLLIANRGEIARRIIKSARAMGIRCILPYTPIDADSMAVREADDVYLLKHHDPRQAYLDIDSILHIAKLSGAEAIHPGYGFLSEHHEFAEQCLKMGLVWIGPPSKAILAMGDKARAKMIALHAGLPLLPCDDGKSQDDHYLYEQAVHSIGFPLLIKACSGGGGKGMRKVEHAAQFYEALGACRREAQSSFGDDRMILERYVEHARHIEVQLLADQYGTVWSLSERDCSSQRRYQKVIEEAPAPDFPNELREALKHYASVLAQSVGYEGAGTIEFLYDPRSKNLYFMEMNTRLQVEHPVTEMITGVDLVAWQIRIACGADLSQELLPQIRGHSLEIRVYAEQTIKNFLPMAGYCTHITWPQGYNIRIDSALDREGVMSPYFDPMIAKIIVWGHTREEARQRMIYALSSTMILGIHHNLDILGRILKHQDFIDVKHHTQWIEHTLLPEIIEEKRNVSSAYLAVAAVLFYKDSSEHLLSHFCHWRMFGEGTSYVYCKDDEDTHYRIAISQLDHHAWVCSDNQNMIEHHVVYHPSRNSFSLDDQPNEIHAVLSNDTLWINGCHIPISMLHHDECRESSPQDFNHENRFRSPMPGKVIRHMVSPQQHVQENTPLVILEAMKMEHTLCSPTSGYVHEFYACPGEQVEEGYIILKFIADEVDVIHPRERSEA